jgi:[acyl-carrier-protein] S-malonyltransferase
MSASVMLYHSLLEGCGDNFLQNNGLELVCTAGHSLGEYSALYVAGVISLEQTSKLLQKRSLLMAAGNANAGMMAIIGADVELISKMIDEVKMQKQDMVLEIANYNSIGQVVISGHVDAIETFSEIAKNNNIKKCIKLNVSNAFHSSLMQEAQNGMRTIIESEDFLNPSCPVIQNYTAQFTTDVKTIKENLVMQISNQVKWVETVQNAIQHGVELFIEIGPKNVLTGLIKRIDANVQTMNIEKLEDIENFQENIKKLFNK